MAKFLRNMLASVGIASVLSYDVSLLSAKEYPRQPQTIEFTDKPVQELTDLLMGERTCNLYHVTSSLLLCEREGRPKPNLYYEDISTIMRRKTKQGSIVTIITGSDENYTYPFSTDEKASKFVRNIIELWSRN